MLRIVNGERARGSSPGIPLSFSDGEGEESMSYNFITMFRQRGPSYHRLLEFRRRTFLSLFFFLVILVLVFITRRLGNEPANSRRYAVPWKERTVPAPDYGSLAPPPPIKSNGTAPKAIKPKESAEIRTVPKSIEPRDSADIRTAPKAVEPRDGADIRPAPNAIESSVSAETRTAPKPKDNLVRREHVNCSSRNVCRSARHPKGEIWSEPGPSCPDYFRWIHEDLKPWRKSGITLEMVEKAKRTASFRLMIVKGRMYIETYSKSFQTRDLFTIWGLVQLMEYYPGMLPDLDLMFDCVDWPILKSQDYSDRNPPPPLFRYCGDDTTLDIAFPDWSFWGWAEINIQPWDRLLNEIYKGNQKIKWEDRDPTAYWKGNPYVAPDREDLMKCNVSEAHDWNARLYVQDWIKESEQGYKKSRLSDQCDHRYKIYIEGSAWSVSLKNILACDSTTLIVKPRYYDFFSRGLLPQVHYWPLRLDKKCESIKFAVDWGNKHPRKAKAIGKAASRFIRKEVNMANVYDYMFHLLTEYAKLLKYKPSVTKRAREHCTDSMLLCSKRTPAERQFMNESLVKRGGRDKGPCNLAGADEVHLQSLEAWRQRKSKFLQQIEGWEEKAWRTGATFKTPVSLNSSLTRKF